MKNQGGLLGKAGKVILILLFVAGFFYFGESCWAATLEKVLISEIYGGGGNSGSYWKNDFIEIYNPNDFLVSLAGWSVWYASASSDS